MNFHIVTALTIKHSFGVVVCFNHCFLVIFNFFPLDYRLLFEGFRIFLRIKFYFHVTKGE